MDRSWTSIGTVASVNPARRELRVEPGRGRAPDLEAATRVEVVLRDGEKIVCRVTGTKVAGKVVVLSLAPGVLRDSVARMKGAQVLADVAAEPESDGLLSMADLPGLEILSEEGDLLGVVRDAFLTPAHGVIEVEQADGKSFMLPVVDEVVVTADLDRGIVVVRDLTPFAVYDED